MRARLRWLALGVVLATGCGGEPDESAAGGTPADTVALLPPYETVPLEAVGRIEGVVTWEGELPAAMTVVLPDSLVRTCRSPSLRLTPVRVVRGGVEEAIVWLDGVRRGKALPASRRFEIATDRCRLTPAAQPAIAGGILNVLSLDRLVHRLLFTREGNDTPVDRVEQFDAGQVVPLESALRLPGHVTVRSDRFPWIGSSIHVFDHPYFAMTSSGGTFVIDSIPPGTHTVVLWHPAAPPRDTTITVSAGDTIRLRLAISDHEA